MITEAALKQMVDQLGPCIKLTAQAIGGKGATLTLEMIRKDFSRRGAVIFDGPGENEIVMFGGR